MQYQINENGYNKKAEKILNFNNFFDSVKVGMSPKEFNNVNSFYKTTKTFLTNQNLISTPMESKRNKNHFVLKTENDDPQDFNNPNYDDQKTFKSKSGYGSGYESISPQIKFPKKQEDYKKELRNKITVDKSRVITEKLKQEIKNFKQAISPHVIHPIQVTEFSENGNNNEKEKEIINQLEKSVHFLNQKNRDLEKSLDTLKINQTDNEIDRLKNENRTILFDNKLIRDENLKLNDYIKEVELELAKSNQKQ